MRSFALPLTGNYNLKNIRVPLSVATGFTPRDVDTKTGLGTFDIAVVDGHFQACEVENGGHDAGGRLLLPGFVDMHVHLDKAFTADRTGFSERGLVRAVELSMADAPNRTVDDLIQRMNRALVQAERKGTAALRTHLDTFDQPDLSPAWQAFAAIEKEWGDRITLQGVALMALFRVDDDDFERRCEQLARRGGILGAFIGAGAANAGRLDRLLGAADAYDLSLDLHVDETLDAGANGLSMLLEAVQRKDFTGKIVVGHCCALAKKPDEEMQATIRMVAEAGIHVTALPLTNGFLQDRSPARTPRLRGIAPVRELAAAGVNVSFASDNVCDAFYPYGDFDLLEVFRNAQFLAHLENEPDYWIGSVNWRAADAMGLEDVGRIFAGGPADAILFEACDWAELFTRPACPRTVLRKGRGVINTAGGANGLASQHLTERRLA